jgi:hypothetical protein
MIYLLFYKLINFIINELLKLNLKNKNINGKVRIQIMSDERAILFNI